MGEISNNGRGVRENVPLGPYTTLGAGGPARFFIEARSVAELPEALAFARARGVPFLPLGNGSNLLVPDEGVGALVARCAFDAVAVEEDDLQVTITVEAGASWDRIVDEAGKRGVFGIENLAGIPGTVGGAAVQNIGAYGGEFSRVFAYAACLDCDSGRTLAVGPEDAGFGYRTSVFKKRPELVITQVVLALSRAARPDLSYGDIAKAASSGVPLSTPAEIAAAVRRIRSGKFPPSGTAGSFFKNPTLPKEAAQALAVRYPELPAFAQADETVKVSLAWLLDHALGLKGYARGPVRLYENQPLVIVAEPGATARDIDALAREVEERVHKALAISIEREVETFGAHRA